MGFSLVALDTDHIKEYVFGTDKLKEIRGASPLLVQLQETFCANHKKGEARASNVFIHR